MLIGANAVDLEPLRVNGAAIRRGKFRNGKSGVEREGLCERRHSLAGNVIGCYVRRGAWGKDVARQSRPGGQQRALLPEFSSMKLTPQEWYYR